MEELSPSIGRRIRIFRRARGLTIQALANSIHKSKATVSKYENGEIVMDVASLYDVAGVLGVQPDQLLPAAGSGAAERTAVVPFFFKGLTQFYMYMFDGRNRQLARSVIDVLSQTGNAIYKVMMYMNVGSYEEYQRCETTYRGWMKHYDALTNLTFRNQDTPMEQYTINILASYLDAEVKWGLACGISSRPLMPTAAKVLIAKKPLRETEELNRELHISKEDIRVLKLYNMFCVM